MGGLGSSVGWVATSVLEDRLGWRGACLLWAGAHMLLGLPLVAWLAPAGPGRRPDHAVHPQSAIRWDRRMVQLAAVFVGAWFVSTCIGAHLPRLLARVGLTSEEAVRAAAMLGVAAVSARLLELVLLRRVSPILTARTAALLHPLGALGILAFGAAAAPAFVVAQGLGNGALGVAAGVLPLTVFGREHYGYRSALLYTPARFIQAAGPALYGLALDRSPAAALALSSGACVLAFAMTFGLAPERQPE
jgi:hypothetical protein